MILFKKSLIFTSFLLLSFFLMAQPPGYVGKRLYTTFNFSSFPTVNGPTQNNNGLEYFGDVHDRDWGIDYELEGELSYVIGRYSSIGITIGQFYTGLKSEAETESLGQENINFSNIQYDRHDLFYRLNVKSIGLHYSWYKSKKGALAPLGNHTYIGIETSFIKGEILDKKTIYSLDEFGLGSSIGHANLNVDPSTVYHSIMLGWSNNQILFDRLIFKVGLRFTLPLSLKVYNGNSRNEAVSNFFYDDNPNHSLFKARTFDRMVSHQMLRINIGLGILIF